MAAQFGRAIAAGIRAERARLGLRQADLAQRLVWSQKRVSEIETGETKLPAEDLPDVCRALGVPLRALLAAADPDDRRALGV